MKIALSIVLHLSVNYFNVTIWKRDVKQAYMQSKPFDCYVFTKPSRDGRISKDKVLRIRLSHFGLLESSSCILTRITSHYLEHLRIKACAFDLCILFRSENNTIFEVTGLATDDSNHTGNHNYQGDEEAAMKSFNESKTDILPLLFLQFKIERTSNLLLASQKITHRQAENNWCG